MTARVRRWSIVAGLIALAAIAVSAWFAVQFTGPQRRAVRPLPRDFGFAAQAVEFSATDGTLLRGWLVPCPGSAHAAILLHGNGSTRSQMIARARLLRSLGYSVLLYDARGHGESAGERVSFGYFETRDLLGAVAFLRARGSTEIGCLGASQGGATVALAARQLSGVRWVVLESVFPDMQTAVDRRFRAVLHVPGWFAGALLRPFAEWRLGVSMPEIAPSRTIGELSCPVFIMGGEMDRYTTADDLEVLRRAAKSAGRFWLVPRAAHVDLYGAAGNAYAEKLTDFLTEAGALPSHR